MLARPLSVILAALFLTGLGATAMAQDSSSGPRTPSCDPPPCLTDIVVPIPARTP